MDNQNDITGFIVLNGHECLYCTFDGTNKTMLYKFDANLPRKHGRGGPSTERYKQLRAKRRQDYLERVHNNAIQLFMNDGEPNINCLVLCASRCFLNDINEMCFYELSNVDIEIMCVSYGGSNGLDQAINEHTN